MNKNEKNELKMSKDLKKSDVVNSRRKLLKAGALVVPVVATLSSAKFAPAAAVSLACYDKNDKNKFNQIPSNVVDIIAARGDSNVLAANVPTPVGSIVSGFDPSSRDHWFYISDQLRGDGAIHSCALSIMNDTMFTHLGGIQDDYNAYWGVYSNK